ncbi:MAG TPA: sulfatase-like hydrolase/transferase [Planctomycetaceae bacterium]|nr:sulfatase-like hydrolase/transferase [Planctomycetaceae bacterium]
MRLFFLLCVLVNSPWFLLAQENSPTSERPPNVILMMTDNHGAWTLGCYGNRDIRTPHIDRIAYEGIRFKNAFSSNAVCSPTRATYLTGLLPSQHGVHCFLRRNEAQMGDDPYCTIDEFRTLPKVFKENGYACGLVGKWHLGGNMTPQEGFDDYWITMPHGATSEFYDAEVIENGELRKEPKYLTDLWTEHAKKFITTNKEKPFFLFLSYNGPYGLGNLLLNPPRNRHYNTYAEQLLPSFPREQMHPWLHNNKPYLNNVVSMRRFAAELSGVDDSVGEVMETLLELGLDNNTLIVFCADQGWIGGQNGLWGMGDHTRPLTAFDGMMRVPLMFRHPTHIRPGQTSDIMVSNYDFMPTLLGYLGLNDKKNLNPNSPGRDFSEVLRDKKLAWQDLVFYEMENCRCIRTKTAKYIHRHPDGPHELYDLETDPGEQINLYGQPQQADLQAKLKDALDAFFELHADKKYNLYKGGTSKAKLLSDPTVGPTRP